MAVKMVKGKLLPIGLDLGTTAVRLAQFRQHEGSYGMIAAASADIPAEKQADFRARLDFCGSAIKGLLSAGGFMGRECVLGLPAEATFVQHVKIARTAPEQIEAAVLQEIQGKLPFPATSAEIRHIVAGEVAGEGDGRQEVIVVAAARETVMACLAMAHKAGLDVSGVNIESCAIVQCFARLFKRSSDANRAILYLDIGQSSTQAVLAHGNRIVFARNLMVAGRQLDAALAEGLKISPQQAWQLRRDVAAGKETRVSPQEIDQHVGGVLNEMTDELTQCLRYYESVFRNQGVERAIFLGGQAMDKRLCQLIAQRLNVPAQIGDPLVRIGSAAAGGSDLGIDRREPQPRWAVAVGLSLGSGQAA
jgi:type IV pilus assembly protein PilM